MKFIHCLKKQVWVVLLLTFALSFLSCQDLEENTYLEYGQVKWGMPPEEVLELLEVPKENVVSRDAVEGVEYYLLENVEFCGEKASQMALNFINLGYQEETWAQFKENARLVTGEWVNLPGEGGKTVHFDAYNLAVYRNITDEKEA